MPKISRLGLLIEGLSVIAIIICVILSKPVSIIWIVLFICGMLFAIVPGIVCAIKQKEKSSIKSLIIVLALFIACSLLMQLQVVWSIK